MKIKLLFILLVLILLIGCSKKNYDEGDLNYKKVCESSGYEWMEMIEMRNDIPISDKYCFGCMVNGNHLCTLNEFNNFTSKD